MASKDSDDNPKPALKPLQVPASQTLSIEHPCIVNNLDRGIKSLGGPNQLGQLLNTDHAPKEWQAALTVRPEDVFATPLTSHHLATSNILLKVTVPKRTGRKRQRGSAAPFVRTDSAAAPSSGRTDGKAVLRSIRDNKDRCETSVVGVIRDTFRYRAITQFQYAASSNPFMQYMKENLLSNDFEKIKEFHLNPAQMLRPGQEVQPSPVLSIVDCPYPYNYRQNASVRIVKDQHGADYSINEAKPGSINLCVVNYDIETVPTGPTAVLPPLDTLDVKFRRLIKLIEEGLKERPVMTTRYQMHLTGELLTGALRRVLPYVGYMFKVGPFRDALIRYGFDPRSHHKYRGFQLSQVQMPHLDKNTKRYGIGPPKPREDVMTYIFDGTEVYTDAKVFQFCDIADPVIRKILDEAPIQEKCEPFVYGWYGSGTWAIVRTLLKDKIDRLVKGDNKDQQWYEHAVKGFPDDIDDLPPSIRPSKDLDQDAAILLAKARSLARNARKSLRRQMESKTGKTVRFSETPGIMPDDEEEEQQDVDLNEEIEDED